MTLQPDYVAATLKELDGVLEALKPHRGVTGDPLRADVHRRWIVERGQEVACGSLFDLFNHLSASEPASPSLRAPSASKGNPSVLSGHSASPCLIAPCLHLNAYEFSCHGRPAIVHSPG